MNKRKIALLAMSACMIAILAIGGTLAYFTDTDYNQNVMTTANVKIDQIEKQRDENGDLEDYDDSAVLFPVTGTTNANGTLTVAYDDAEKYLFSQDRNVIDKIVTVKNTGSVEAYVRTLFAFEVPFAPEGTAGNLDKDGKYIDIVNMPNYLYTVMGEGLTPGKGFTLPKENDDYVIIEKGGVAYLVTEYYYKNDSKLAAGATSHESLKQIYLAGTATNEHAETVVGPDGKYEILVLSQAVQTEGFTDPKTALDTAFGVTNKENALKWFTTYTESKDESKD